MNSARADEHDSALIKADFLVLGAGMAGVSVAFELAESAQVIVLEQEAQPGYHSTGRSAALFSEIYGNEVIRGLSRSSRSLLFDPPRSFSDAPLVRERGALFIARCEQQATLEQFRGRPDVARGTRTLATAEATALVPVLRPESVAMAVFEPGAMDIEVHRLQQAFIKGLRARGGRVVCGCDLHSITRLGSRWILDTSVGAFSASVVIDAAGAWADDVARRAGVQELNLRPMRRTALLVEPPPDMNVDTWPLVIDADETFYFKPDAGKLLLSPADETPSQPCDAQPDDLDVAIAVERVEQATTLTIRRVTHRWAGLRSFVADRTPVVGFDTLVEGFFWLCAQGGYGIQTAPALARVAAALALGREIPADIVEQGVSADALSPARLASPAHAGSGLAGGIQV